jgi:hypothetical protein
MQQFIEVCCSTPDEAMSLNSMIQDKQRYLLEHPKVRVGPGFIELRNLFLVGINRVDKISWQPILQFSLFATHDAARYW